MISSLSLRTLLSPAGGRRSVIEIINSDYHQTQRKHTTTHVLYVSYMTATGHYNVLVTCGASVPLKRNLNLVYMYMPRRIAQHGDGSWGCRQRPTRAEESLQTVGCWHRLPAGMNMMQIFVESRGPQVTPSAITQRRQLQQRSSHGHVTAAAFCNVRMHFAMFHCALY